MNLNLNVPERHNSIYLIYLSTFGATGQKIYKYGKTYNSLGRFRGYPKDSTLLFFCRVKDCHHVESIICDVFKKHFKRRRDIGLEYFEGDPKIMIEYINQIIDHMNQRMENKKIEDMKVKYATYLRFTIYDRHEIPDNLSDILLENYKNSKLNIMKKTSRKKIIKKIDIQIKKIDIRIKNMDFRKGILAAADIDDESFNEHMDLYQKDITQLKEDDIYSMEKYLYMKNWKIDKTKIDSDFLDKWYGKTYILYNLRLLKNHEIQEGIISICDNKKLSNNEKAGYIREIIETLGFSLDNVGRASALSKDVYDVNRERACKECKIFKDKKIGALFDVKSDELKTNKAFMGFINILLQHYGLRIRSDRKSTRDKKTKNKVDSYFYYFDYINNINDYV